MNGKQKRGIKWQKYVYLQQMDFEEIEELTVVDLLRRAGAEVFMVSVGEGLTIKGAHNIELKADVLFDEICYDDADILVLPGGMPGTLNLRNHEKLCALLKEFAAKDKKIAAICAAPMILGELGLLKGKKATCYPGFEDKLIEAEVCTDRVVRDGNITTSRGLGTAIPFALELISQLYGKEKAEEIKKSVIYGH